MIFLLSNRNKIFLFYRFCAYKDTEIGAYHRIKYIVAIKSSIEMFVIVKAKFLFVTNRKHVCQRRIGGIYAFVNRKSKRKNICKKKL